MWGGRELQLKAVREREREAAGNVLPCSLAEGWSAVLAMPAGLALAEEAGGGRLRLRRREEAA